MGTSGPNHAEAMRQLGFEVKKGASYAAPPEVFTIPPKGHYLHDPTSPTTAPDWLVKSIDKHGQQQSVRAKKIGDTLFVSKGRSRVLAIAEVNRLRKQRKEPLLLVDYDLDDKGLTEEMLAETVDEENFLRRETGAYAQALAIAKYRGKSYPDGRIAELVRCKPRDVVCLARINDCVVEFRDAVRDGKVDWRVAEVFAQLSPEKQRERLERMISTGATKGRAAKRAARGGEAMPSKPKPRPPAFIGRFRERVLDAPVGDDEQEAIESAVAAVLGFLAGDDAALDEYPKLRDLAAQAAEKKKAAKAAE